MKITYSLGAAVVIAAAAFLLVDRADADGDPFAYRDAGVIAKGKTIYDRNCASCHGANLEGEDDWRTRDADGYLPAPPHDETGHTWHHPDAQLFAITKYGTEEIVGGGYRSNMMGFEGVLSDADIRAVLAYIKSTWPARIQSRHDELNAATSVPAR